MKKITQPKPQSRSMHQPPASGQRPHSVTRRDVMTAVKELIDYHQIGRGFTCVRNCRIWNARRSSR
jgi:hypothetical protein